MSIARKPRKPLTKITDFEEMELSLDAIKVCPELFQVRARLDKKVSQRYSKCRANGSNFPRVLVFRVAEVLYLIDGFHRFDAWEQLGLPTIPAVIRDGTMEEALLAAFEANGDDVVDRKLNEEDRRHAVELMIRNEKFRNWSDKEISRRCGLGRHLVMKARLNLNKSHNIPLPDRVEIFRDGRSTGRLTNYRANPGNLRSRKPDTSSAYIGYFVNIDGSRKSLGTDLNEAESRLEKLKNERVEMGKCLSTVSNFVRWLMRRGILAHGVPCEICPVGGLQSGGTVLQPINDPSLDDFVSKSHRLLLVRAAIPGINRCILIGYVGANGAITKCLPFSRMLGIEVMTPEEFVAEFGPEGDDGRGEAQPPSD